MIATLTLSGKPIAIWTRVPRITAVTGHVLTADTATSGTRLLAIADVICSAHHRDWLARFPGCAVAVTTVGDRLLASTRADDPLTFPAFIRNEGALGPMVIGIFLHAWLAAGGSPTGLDTGCLVPAGPGPWSWVQWPQPFSMTIEVG